MPSAPTYSLITISAVGRRFGVSRHFVRKAMRAGEIETIDIAGQTYLKTASATAWGKKLLARGQRAVA
jgi:hypothetical protein